MIIRRATADDAEAIATVHRASWQSAYRGIIDQAFLDNMQVDGPIKRWRAALGDPEYKVQTFVAVIDGEVKGWADVCRAREPEWFPNHAELRAIYVDPNCFRSGAGRALFEQIKVEAVKLAPEMVIWVLEDNKSARKFYEKMGGVLVPDRTKIFDIAGKQLKEVAYNWQF